MKLTREIKTGILAISSILLFIWGYSFLKGSDLLTDYKKFYVHYTNVEGLVPSSLVTLNGLTIGKVKTIDLQKDGRLLVELQIKNDFAITNGSVAEIYSPSPIGGKQIAILVNKNDTKPAESGAFLVSATKMGLIDGLLAGQIDPLKQKLDKLLDNANSMLVNVNEIFDAKTKENLQSSLANLNETLAQFKVASKEVNTMLADNKSKIGNTMTNIEKASGNFSKLSDSLAKANIGKSVKSLEKTLASVDKIMLGLENGNGTMGKLIKDDALYNNFSKTSKELELLLQDVRLYPTRYVNVSLFGKKNKPYIAPNETDTIKK
ncbi:MlaD family protein [Flavobacterium sp.]|uniref:MlaD family protein n=1 Tax=Flavobacterium sp. TaxID=239 RepID=UPI003753B162